MGISWHQLSICQNETTILQSVELERLTDMETTSEKSRIEFQINGETTPQIYAFTTVWVSFPLYTYIYVSMYVCVCFV